MSNNPIFRNYRTQILYVIIWTVISIVQMITIFIATDLSFELAAIDSLVFNALFAIAILSLWYPVYYIQWEKKSWYLNVLLYIILAVVLVALWMGVGYVIMSLFAEENQALQNFETASVSWKIVQGILVYTVALLVYYLFVYVEKLNEKAANELYLNQLIKDGELNLLKSQINPHFLFNSLNSVIALTIKNPEKAREMLIAVSDYLRHTVSSTKQETSTLQQEIENIERYLSIEKLRFGNKLMYVFEIEKNCLLQKIPSMLLQPLFENAIKHGVYESTESVTVTVHIQNKTDNMHIEIRNNFDAGNISFRKGSGIGLTNIRERLRLSYGSDASLQTKIEENQFVAILQVPLRIF